MLFLLHAHLVMLGDKHLACFDLGDFGVAYPFDMLVAHTRFQDAFGIAHTAQPEMTDVGFGGDKGHRHLGAYLAAAQIGIHDECIFVSRPEAGRPLHRTHDDRAGILGEIIPCFMRFHRVIHVANREGMPAVWTKSFDLIEGQLGPGGNDQIIVIYRFPVVKFKLIFFRMYALYPGRDKVDAFSLQIGAHREFNILAVTPFHGHPGIGRRKVKSLAVRNDRHLVPLADLLLHFVSCRHAA